MKKKGAMKMLQARSDGRQVTSFSMDSKTSTDIQFINDFCQRLFHLNPSASVIIRRAIQAYAWKLMLDYGKAYSPYRSSIKDGEAVDIIECLDALSGMIETEREAMFQAANKPEEYHGG